MASWSLMLPPGSAITLTPLWHASSTASFHADGKKASLANAAPLTSSPAFFKAILKLSRRFGCPLPIPSIQLFCIINIALLFTCLTHNHANWASLSSLSCGVFPETTLN
nr:hypothetical protein Iba_chr06aCG7010 [Ipomoea batatas]